MTARLREISRHTGELLTGHGAVVGRSGPSTGPTPLEFQQQEAKAFGKGVKRAPFNVLYVQTPRPAFMDSPLASVLVDTLKETVQLVKPVMRFGLPETSLKTKCPYWRDDNLPLPSSTSFPLRKLLAARRGDIHQLTSPEHSAELSEHHTTTHEHQPHIKPSNFVFGTPPNASLVAALNIGAYIWLSTNRQ